ncbi:MAG: P-loop NTPase, partial [Balneolales bacterium]|nr:P-loop NTPase [Balneolales bacterium]
MTNLFEKTTPFIGTVISGKGGVGKSITSVNTAAMLNDMGYKAAIIDADLGLANCATLLNEPVEATVCEWIEGKCSPEDVMQNCNGITLVTAADDPHETNMDADVIMNALDQVVAHLRNTHDFILIDTPAGVGEMTLWALDTAQLGILVLVDEPAAISDVYRLCKYVYSIDPSYSFAGIVNFAANEESAGSTFKRFNNILNYFLEKHCAYLGFVPETASVKQAVQKQN